MQDRLYLEKRTPSTEHTSFLFQASGAYSVVRVLEFVGLSHFHPPEVKIDFGLNGKLGARLRSSVSQQHIARMTTGLNHRDFCIRLADSALLQFFLHVGRVD